MSSARRNRKRGFSLLELVIVVVIIGIIAAIAIPRMSRGTAGAADSALTGDLAVLRNAMDLFAAEHGGKFPKADDKLADRLTGYTNDQCDSAPVSSKDKDHAFGPYLRAVPKLPIGANKGSDKFTSTAPPGTDAGGWYYSDTSGEVKANCGDGETDASGVKYNTY
jgi:prepilin-type N-terminal cleavage/methylation domain-containing protein